MIEKTGNDLVVIASHPQELAEGQVAVIQKVKEKELEAQDDLASAEHLLTVCKESGLNIPHAERGVRRAKQRVIYLDKVRQALEAGYVLVPNFPGDTIAIRVKEGSTPKRDHQEGNGWQPSVDPQEGHILPAGEGQYVDPLPYSVTGINRSTNDKGEAVTRHYAYATEWDDEIALPVEFVKPTVIERTGMGMTRKIFDEIAVTRNMDMRGASTAARVNKGDPIVVGRIYDRQNKKAMSFLVAWFVDTKDI